MTTTIINCEICEKQISFEYVKANDGVTICLDCATDKIYNGGSD